MKRQITRTGPYKDGCCERCGKPLRGKAVPLELDQRIGEYHDFGDVPQEYSQGFFDFGPDCAEILRARARAALRQTTTTRDVCKLI